MHHTSGGTRKARSCCPDLPSPRVAPFTPWIALICGSHAIRTHRRVAAAREVPRRAPWRAASILLGWGAVPGVMVVRAVDVRVQTVRQARPLAEMRAGRARQPAQLPCRAPHCRAQHAPCARRRRRAPAGLVGWLGRCSVLVTSGTTALLRQIVGGPPHSTTVAACAHADPTPRARQVADPLRKDGPQPEYVPRVRQGACNGNTQDWGHTWRGAPSQPR